jgi:hypothetical protein
MFSITRMRSQARRRLSGGVCRRPWRFWCRRAGSSPRAHEKLRSLPRPHPKGDGYLAKGSRQSPQAIVGHDTSGPSDPEHWRRATRDGQEVWPQTPRSDQHLPGVCVQTSEEINQGLRLPLSDGGKVLNHVFRLTDSPLFYRSLLGRVLIQRIAEPRPPLRPQEAEESRDRLFSEQTRDVSDARSTAPAQGAT